jgi:hypothetical protein
LHFEKECDIKESELSGGIYMNKRNNRYKQMEMKMSCVLLAELIFFIIFLFASGFGVIWLKVIMSIITIITSVLCLGFLFLSQELLRRRSLWMTAAAAAFLLCTIFSLILGYPSPAPV